MPDIHPPQGNPPSDAGTQDEGHSSGFMAFCRKWTPGLLVIAGVAPINFALVIPRPVLKSMDAELGGSVSADLLLKMIIAVIGLAVVVGAPLAGILIRKFGQRASIITSLGLFVIAGCLPYFLDNLYFIVFSRALLGFAVGAIQVSAVALAGEYYPDDQRAKILGFMMASASFAALVLGPLSGLLGEIGWRIPFLLYLTGVPFLLLAIIGLPRDTPVELARIEGPGDEAPAFTFPYWLASLGFVGGALMTLPPVYLAFRLGDIGVTSPAMVGVSFIAISIPELICASFYGYFRRKASNAFMCLLGFGLAAAGLGLIAISPTYIGILLGMGLLGPSIAFVYASIMEQASVAHEDRARIVGIVISAIFLSLVAGTFAAEPVFVVFGSAGVMMSLAMLGVIMIAILFARGLSGRTAVHAGTSGTT